MTRRRPTGVSVEKMRRHVTDLCEKHDIVVGFARRAHAIHAAEEIHIPPIKSAISYATALHEIGHILGRHQRSNSTIVRERWAWHWARVNALIWTPAMEQSARKALDWYAPRAAEIDRKKAREKLDLQKRGYVEIAPGVYAPASPL
jgi:hypothetical protein